MPAIAFRKPFTDETQDKRDSINMEQHDVISVNCSLCDTEYVLVYPSNATDESVESYKQAINQGMANCSHHPPFIEINF